MAPAAPTCLAMSTHTHTCSNSIRTGVLCVRPCCFTFVPAVSPSSLLCHLRPCSFAFVPAVSPSSWCSRCSRVGYMLPRRGQRSEVRGQMCLDSHSAEAPELQMEARHAHNNRIGWGGDRCQWRMVATWRVHARARVRYLNAREHSLLHPITCGYCMCYTNYTSTTRRKCSAGR